MAPKQWQNWANGVLGVWMFASPWIFAFATGAGSAARTAWMLGAAIVIFAGLAVYLPKAWEEAINILLGIYLLASRWAFMADRDRLHLHGLLVEVRLSFRLHNAHHQVRANHQTQLPLFLGRSTHLRGDVDLGQRSGPVAACEMEE
jgi:hypothetical protein